MRYWMVAVLSLVICGAGVAQDGSAPTDQQRIAQLEARVAQLEKLIKPLLIEYEVKLRRTQNRNLAKKRINKDRDTYTQEQLKAMETLYQAASKNLRGENAKENLIKVVQDYGKSNRAGCALVYLGQITSGDEQLQYLQQAIDSHADCFYGDGVQVGAYARLILAARHANDKQYDKATKLLDELAAQFKRSLDHRGQPLELSIESIRKQIAEAQKP